MAKLLIVFISFLCVLNANGNVFSNIPTAKIEVINLNPTPCEKSCLKDLAKKQKVFSFIARFDKKVEDEYLQNVMLDYTKQVGVYYKVRFDLLEDKLEVALLIPKKTIGKYSTTTIDTILSYLAFRDIDFRFKVFDSVDENAESITNAINALKNERFSFVIAILSKEDNLPILQNLQLPIYIPTLKKPQNWDENSNNHIVFGGIDYESQIDLLLQEANQKNIISYNDDSTLGAMIGHILEDKVKEANKFNFIKEVVTNKDATNFSHNLERRKNHINTSNVFLNTRVIISGLLLSQIGILKEMPDLIFSTQVNYNPAILSLLRGINTKNLIIANSIGETNDNLLEYGYLLSSDLKYDWVNYSTALGMDLFLSQMKENIERYFSEEIKQGQVLYKTNLYGIENDIFVKH